MSEPATALLILAILSAVAVVRECCVRLARRGERILLAQATRRHRARIAAMIRPAREPRTKRHPAYAPPCY